MRGIRRLRHQRTIRTLTRGRFDPPKADEDPADHLNLRFKRSGAEEQ